MKQPRITSTKQTSIKTLRVENECLPSSAERKRPRVVNNSQKMRGGSHDSSLTTDGRCQAQGIDSPVTVAATKPQQPVHLLSSECRDGKAKTVKYVQIRIVQVTR